MDFTVSPDRTGFRGAEEHCRLKGAGRFKIYGVLLDGIEPADEGAPIIVDCAEVGGVTIFVLQPVEHP